MITRSIALSLLCGMPLAAQAVDVIPAPSEASHLGAEVPDVDLHVAGGREVKLSSLWEEKPVILGLVFSRCSGICSPFLRSVRVAVNRVQGAGVDYRLVAVSIDPDDTPEQMAAMAEGLGLADHPGWVFATTDPESIRPLADAIGFRYRWVPERQQFDHPASLVAIKDGRCVRILTGGAVTRARFAELVSELRGEFVSIYPNSSNVLFRCFEYDPVKGFSFGWGIVLLLAPSVAGIGLVFVLFTLRRRPNSNVVPEIP